MIKRHKLCEDINKWKINERKVWTWVIKAELSDSAQEKNIFESDVRSNVKFIFSNLFQSTFLNKWKITSSFAAGIIWKTAILSLKNQTLENQLSFLKFLVP